MQTVWTLVIFLKEFIKKIHFEKISDDKKVYKVTHSVGKDEVKC